MFLCQRTRAADFGGRQSLKKKFAWCTTELRPSGGGSGSQPIPRGRCRFCLSADWSSTRESATCWMPSIDSVRRLNSRLWEDGSGANPRVDEACRRWRWFETLPHSQVLDVMMESDVLVLPSLGEGFGLVVTEALACGLPVIVTPNVGASDLVRDGQEGFVVPVCSADADCRAVAYSPPRPGNAG